MKELHIEIEVRELYVKIFNEEINDDVLIHGELNSIKLEGTIEECVTEFARVLTEATKSTVKEQRNEALANIEKARSEYKQWDQLEKLLEDKKCSE